MEGLIGITIVGVVVAIIVGLIKPTTLRLKHVNTRLKVCGYGMLLFMVLIAAMPTPEGEGLVSCP